MPPSIRRTRFLLFLLLLSLVSPLLTPAAAADPAASPSQLLVFFFYGIFGDNEARRNFAANLTAEGRVFVPLSFCSGICSTQRLTVQVPLAIAQIRALVANDSRFGDGYIFMTHSQGATIARAVIEEMDDHKVRKLISLAGFVNGFFYTPQPEDLLALTQFINQTASSLIPPAVFNFSKYSQENFASGVFQFDFDAMLRTQPELYWRTPVQDQWAAVNSFLPAQNNLNKCAETGEAAAKCQSDKTRRRANFLKLQAVHLLVSPEDGAVVPWQSSILGQYSELASAEEIKTKFSSLRVLGMESTAEYQQDTYGLRTLDARGGLLRHTVKNAPHFCWIQDVASCVFSEIYDQHMYPLLVADAPVEKPSC